MQGNWNSVASGTRLWRNVMIARVAVAILFAILMFVWARSAMSRGVMSGAADLDAVIGKVRTMQIIQAVIELVFAGLLVLAGKRWKGAPAESPGVGNANAFFVLSIVSAVGVVITQWAQIADPLKGTNSLIALPFALVGLAAVIVALSMHEKQLAYLDSEKSFRAAKLRGQFIALFVVAIICGFLSAFAPLFGILLLGVGIAGLVWFIFLLIFLGDAAAIYEQGPQTDVSAFD